MNNNDVKKLVEEKIENGATLVQAIHDVHDDLTSKETIQLACKKGCGFCCHQVVPCSKIEWDSIEEYMEKNNMRDSIYEKNKDTISEWKQYLIDNWNEIMKNGQKPFNDWVGKKPCIFLDDEGACSIHSVRPMSCRVVNSTKTCTSFNQPESAIYRFEYERPLVEMIVKTGYMMSIIDLFTGLKEQ